MGDFDNWSSGLYIDEKAFNYRKYGLTLAVVTNITDPDKLNRVKVKEVVDESDKDILESDWCPVISPMSGKERGMFFMPGLDDLVLLAYLNGDPQCPYVVGGVWNGESAPPFTVEEGKNLQFMITTPQKNEFLMRDEEEKEFISLTTPKGAFIKLADESEDITVGDKDAKNNIVINYKEGKVTVTSAEEITFTCGDASISLKKDGTIDISGKTVNVKGTDVKVEATNEFAGKGASVGMEATGELKMKGATGTVEAQSQLTLKGTAAVNIN